MTVDNRGVFVAQWVGPNDEVVLIARNRHRRLIGEPVTVPMGTDADAVAGSLWERVDADDPAPTLTIVR